MNKLPKQNHHQKTAELKKELAVMNRELKIEGALERVRSVAMIMKKPADMLKICRTISLQLQKLGIKEIRNVQTAVIYEKRGIYRNFEYYAKHKKTFITDVDYSDPLQKKTFGKILKERGTHAHAQLKGKKLKDWYKFQKTTNVFIDKYLETAHSLNYYWYSLGSVSLGISTYYPLTEEEKSLFKRFLNVFELAYRRYLDIEKAEAQAREAQIEAALERVRAKAMAMHSSNDISETMGLVFKELPKLGIHSLRCGVVILSQESFKGIFYAAATTNESDSQTVIGEGDMSAHPVFMKQREYWTKNENYFVTLKGKELSSYYKELFKRSSTPYNPKEHRKQTEYGHYFSFSDGMFYAWSEETYSESDINILNRFKSIIDLTFRRYFDLKKAEAQAREAEIQLALERIRARTMAMHKSDELSETARILFEQFDLLGKIPDRMGIGIIDEENKKVEFWLTDQSGNELTNEFSFSLDEPTSMSKIYKAWKERKESLIVDLTGKNLEDWLQYVTKEGRLPINLNNIQGRRVHHTAFFSHGFLIFTTNGPIANEMIQLLVRFAHVFQQTYTRFLDLQKAEAQAREAEIQLALERVRARTMAMQKSDELSETVYVLFQQFRELGENPDQTTIGVINEQEHVIEYWVTMYGQPINKVFKFSIDEPHVTKKIYKAWKENKESIVIDLRGKALSEFMAYRAGKGGAAVNPNEKRRIIHVSFFSKGCLIVQLTKDRSEESIKLLERFAAVFEQTYTRFLDLQKSEAQAREVQIEAALERVRSRTMGMQKSEELKEVIQLVYDQFVHLKINVEHTGFIIDYKERDDLHIWLADQREIPSEVTIPCFDSIPNNSIKEAKENGQDSFTYVLAFEEKNKFYRDLFKFIPGVPEEALEYYFSCPGLAGSGVLLENIGLYIENFSGTPYTNEENNTLMRFGKVFQQTYTRFLDLKKAEAQAREAQIETALERVRSRTMGMHKSNELKDVVRLLYKEFRILVTDIDSVNIQLKMDSSKDIHFWASVEKDIYPELYHVPYVDLPIFEKIYNAFNSQEDGFFDYLLNKEEKDAFFRGIFKIQPVPPQRKKMIKNAEGMVMMGWFHKHSGIDIVRYNLKHFGEEEKEIVKRFAAAFEQTYIRILDLKKAETQAREAQIEAALERVRARTMAMHKSDELADTAAILFQQMTELGVTPERLNICLIKEEEKVLEIWATDQQGIKISHHFNASLDEPTTGKRVYDAWKEKKKSIIIDLSGKELNDWIRYVRKVMGMTIKAELVREHRIHSVAFFSQGMIITTTPEPLPEESIKLLERFADVFNLTYRRFLDLQKAEAQAREAEIELALERVRARTMAMHSSQDVGDAVGTLFDEVKNLKTEATTCGIAIIHDTGQLETWTVTSRITNKIPGEKRQLHMGYLDISMHPFLLAIVEAFKNNQSDFSYNLEGESMIAFFKGINDASNYSGNFDLTVLPPKIFNKFFFFREGALFVESLEELSSVSSQIFTRFAAVFGQTYRRYLDLKKAEAQAIEAIKQASLDRIRGEIASMRTAEDLNRITPIVWRELKTLEVPFIRCGVFIIDEEQENTHVYLTTPEGKSLGVLNLSIKSNELTRNSVEHWKKKQVYKEHWNKEEFITWTKSMMELGQVQDPETYQGSSTPPESLNLHFVPFAQGMLYVGDVSPLTDEKLDLVKTLAEAFSIAYARYEDFRNLEEAKNKIEITLSELKAAQAQLIHSEKLASLGELTAGIAHEIKNPLNFVNNFSEISSELLDEVKEELEKNDKEEVLAILEDLKSNLEKINHHGKRADSIVKGMLLHSRGTSGEKTPTDINNLLDEYVNLAYHGMRAKDKEFNITIEKDYDKSIEKINVVPQDISRAFLNIINNGCYAAYDRRKKSGDDFTPIIKVSTKNLTNKVEVRIKDNGNGIPDKIKDKIFQPFFTTKPTGEGTGLGLSLTYDIVTKVHGGELKVETKEGEGTEFIIQIPVKT